MNSSKSQLYAGTIFGVLELETSGGPTNILSADALPGALLVEALHNLCSVNNRWSCSVKKHPKQSQAASDQLGEGTLQLGLP